MNNKERDFLKLQQARLKAWHKLQQEFSDTMASHDFLPQTIGYFERKCPGCAAKELCRQMEIDKGMKNGQLWNCCCSVIGYFKNFFRKYT